MTPTVSHSRLGLDEAERAARQMLEDIVGLTAVVIATLDGFDLVSSLRSQISTSRLAAMASSIAAIGDVVGREVGWRQNTGVIVENIEGFAVVRRFTSPSAALVIIVIADSSAVLAQVVYRTSQLTKMLSAQ